MELDISALSFLIHLFVYVGAGFFGLLIVLTGAVWSIMLGEKIVELAGRRMGFLYAGHFYCGLSMTRLIFGSNTKEDREMCGKLLYIRYQQMRDNEPDVAASFNKEFVLDTKNNIGVNAFNG